jgi:preprotein translocase subunit SecD
MKHLQLKLGASFLVFIVLVACSSTASNSTPIATSKSALAPSAIIIVTCEQPSEATPDLPKVAFEVIQKRLHSAFGSTAKASIDQRNLRIELENSAQISLTQRLVTERGEVILWDLSNPIPVGSAVPKDIQPLFTNADILQAEVRKSEMGDSWEVWITFTPRAKQALTEYTTKSLGHFVAIAFDGKVVTVPIIRAPVTEGKVPISGENIDKESADALAAQLNGGQLTTKCVIISAN